MFVYLRPATLEGNPSKLQSHVYANNKPFDKKNRNIFNFFYQNSCVFQTFVVPLHSKRHPMWMLFLGYYINF